MLESRWEFISQSRTITRTHIHAHTCAQRERERKREGVGERELQDSTLQWHKPFNKTTLPNPSQTLPPNGEPNIKYMRSFNICLNGDHGESNTTGMLWYKCYPTWEGSMRCRLWLPSVTCFVWSNVLELLKQSYTGSGILFQRGTCSRFSFQFKICAIIYSVNASKFIQSHLYMDIRMCM